VRLAVSRFLGLICCGVLAACGGRSTADLLGSGNSNTGGAGAGAGGAGMTPGGTASSSASGASGASGASSPSGPSLPPIEGDCPTFKSGTATIGGLAGISLQVGERKQGTGSLVFYWHGTGSSAAEVNALLPAAVRQEILGAGGIIVSFGGSTRTGGDCSGTNTFSKDDFKIADLIAACAVRDHGIEPRRIYTTGCSAGGLQAGCMGALRSSYVAAVVPNSGGLVFNQPIQNATRTPAVMTMHGGASDQVVVAFSQTSATYDKLMKGAGSFVVNCDHGGGHCAAPAKLYTAGWEFMKAHPFGAEPEPYASGLPESFPDYCSVY
jgi:predicted esterase